MLATAPLFLMIASRLRGASFAKNGLFRRASTKIVGPTGAPISPLFFKAEVGNQYTNKGHKNRLNESLFLSGITIRANRWLFFVRGNRRIPGTDDCLSSKVLVCAARETKTKKKAIQKNAASEGRSLEGSLTDALAPVFDSSSRKPEN